MSKQIGRSFPVKGAVVVTGASSGMGRACALYLDSHGFRVFAGVRKEKDADSLRQEASNQLTPLFIDVTDESSIASATSIVSEAVGEAGLVGLVNNAGVGVPGPIEYLPISDLRRQMEINVIGQVAVIQAFLPLIRKAKGRIINVGSVGGKITIPFGGALCGSKHALESINDALRMELHPWGIHVCLIGPGEISTPAVDKLMADSEALLLKIPEEGVKRYGDIFREFLNTAVAREKAGSPPEMMARTVFHALTAKVPKTRYPVGPSSKLLPLLARIMPSKFLDKMRFKLFSFPKKFGAWE
ncbi:SDR family oxidoreductase [Paenibacillus sp. KQZ6P-2]|uniref:SDR family oxidoreductase n=1 Tax=Paenibacillus mangrovi TaxID=2931978 RepID=A0A9X1WTS9_9BACL|nr:SDR family oxidoreductase [Paenibacillus mangrovi]MCJ8013453.1 SDR family oxidoreductase [Paenibacillus mangrovi]